MKLKKTSTLIAVLCLICIVATAFFTACTPDDNNQFCEATEHIWDTGRITLKATCEETGIMLYTCEVCNMTNEEEISVLGHDLQEHKAKAAACTEIGWEAYQACSRCDYTTYKEISVLGHDLQEHEAKAATCAEIGWEAYQACSRCDYTTYKEISVLEHDLQEHEAKAATCTEIGWEAYQTCSNCNYTTYKEIGVLGHDYVNKICTRCEDRKVSEGLLYDKTSDGTGYRIIEMGDCRDEELIIPAIYNGLPVKEIADRAFYEYRLTSIEIPSSVTSIGNNAFYDCRSLTSVTFGADSQLTTIGDGAFYGCYWWLTSMEIPSSVTSIGNDAFAECRSLASVTFGADSQLTTIGDGAFYECYKLTSIEIPGNVTTISDGAFYRCYELTSIEIPSNVTTIGNDAFSCCYKLKTVKMTDNVTYIGESAFSGCAVLSDINLSKGLTKIEYRAFDSSGLVELTIPEGVKEIAEFAFESCKALKTIKLPKTVTTLGERAFAYTEKLETIEIDPANPVFHVVNNCLIEKSSKTLVVGCLGSEIPEDSNVVTTIGYGAFMGSSIKEVIIPGNIRKIETYAFGGCRSLERIFYKGDRFVFEDAIGGAGTTLFATLANEDLIVEFETGDSYKPLAL